jgi:hypothetical protein
MSLMLGTTWLLGVCLGMFRRGWLPLGALFIGVVGGFGGVSMLRKEKGKDGGFCTA